MVQLPQNFLSIMEGNPVEENGCTHPCIFDPEGVELQLRFIDITQGHSEGIQYDRQWSFQNQASEVG
jgi:hypothetical protein